MGVGASSGDGGASLVGEIISSIKRYTESAASRSTLLGLSLGWTATTICRTEKLRRSPFICIWIPYV